MKKFRKILIIILSFIAFLSLAEIALCNSLPDKGRKIEKMEKEIKALEEENQELRLEIATKGSLINIAEKAEAGGFKKPLVIYLREKSEIAFEP